MTQRARLVEIAVIATTLLQTAVLLVACQQAVSTDFARSAKEVIDPSINGFQEMAAMSDARKQIKTTQDQVIYDKLKIFDQLRSQLQAANAEAHMEFLYVKGGQETCTQMEKGEIPRDDASDPEPEWTWHQCQKANEALKQLESLKPQVRQTVAEIQKGVGAADSN